MALVAIDYTYAIIFTVTRMPEKQGQMRKQLCALHIAIVSILA
jgi:hypothetical protein